MKKQELMRDMEKCIGTSFPSISAICRYMKVGDDFVKNHIVNGLEYLPTGRAKLYFIRDVADRILEMKRA